MANRPGMRVGPGTLTLFGISQHLVMRNGHRVIALGVVKRMSKITQPGRPIVVNALLEGVDRVFARELSASKFRIIIQRQLDLDPFLQVNEALVNAELGNRFGCVGIGTIGICPLLNKRLNGFFNLMQAGFGQWNSTAIWFEHRLHAWTLLGRIGWD